MFANQSKLLLSMTLVLGILGLQACGNSSSEPKEKVEIKAAPKLTNDATTYANEAWKLINQVEPFVYRKQLNLIKKLLAYSTTWLQK